MQWRREEEDRDDSMQVIDEDDTWAVATEVADRDADDLDEGLCGRRVGERRGPVTAEP
jgi:hypothetical protein